MRVEAEGERPARFSVVVRYAAGHEQAHEHLTAEQAEQAVGAFLRDLLALKGRGITKLVVEIET